VEVLNAWPMLRHPGLALAKLASVAIGLFMLGLLPWVDNYSHVVGFIFGFLLAYALLPFVAFGPYERRRKYFLIWLCLGLAAVMFAGQVVLFYGVSAFECQWCKYLSCVPIISDFCVDQNINLSKKPVWSV
jgi:hypothetical protein